MCVSNCPYKKVYFNHNTGKAEKCTMCYPRIEVGLPTVCSETCVGRLRYLGIILYDVDAVSAAVSQENEQDLLEAQLDLMLDPSDPQVIAAAIRDGIPADWLEAAAKSPVYKLIKKYRVALSLHPEYRTMPMVWYVPPLSPIVDSLRETGNDAEDSKNLFGALNSLRIPVEYLAELFTAGDTEPVLRSLKTLAAMRSYMRDVNLGQDPKPEIPASVGMSEETLDEMYRLLAIAKYEDRYVIPKAHAESAQNLEEMGCSLDVAGGPGQFGQGPFGESSGRPIPVAIETFHGLKDRQTSEVLIPLSAMTMNLKSWSDGSND